MSPEFFLPLLSLTRPDFLLFGLRVNDRDPVSVRIECDNFFLHPRPASVSVEAANRTHDMDVRIPGLIVKSPVHRHAGSYRVFLYKVPGKCRTSSICCVVSSSTGSAISNCRAFRELALFWTRSNSFHKVCLSFKDAGVFSGRQISEKMTSSL